MNDEIHYGQIWDQSLANAILGKILLVGLTFLNEDGSLIEQQQFFGHVQSVSQNIGIALALEGNRLGETYLLPPDTRAIKVANPAKYRLASTGEVVINPDYTVKFSIRKQLEES
jgi:hypothetical protein